MTNDYVAHQRCLKILHDFSYKVIRERKEEIAKEKQKAIDDTNDEEDESFCRKKLAFLDLLIEASKDGEVLSTDDIREEVDTFMFEVTTDKPIVESSIGRYMVLIYQLLL